MGLRVIPTAVHGIIDYASSGALYTTPTLLGLNDMPPSARTLRLASGGAVASSLLTDYELGVVKLIPMPGAPDAGRHERRAVSGLTIAVRLRQG
jgi:hypothetical protein